MNNESHVGKVSYLHRYPKKEQGKMTTDIRHDLETPADCPCEPMKITWDGERWVEDNGNVVWDEDGRKVLENE